MACTEKAARPQVPDEEFKCPKCGAPAGTFVIEDSECFDSRCLLLHESDLLVCYECRYETTGKALALRYKKQADLVTCPCCKGKGVVVKGAEKPSLETDHLRARLAVLEAEAIRASKAASEAWATQAEMIRHREGRRRALLALREARKVIRSLKGGSDG